LSFATDFREVKVNSFILDDKNWKRDCKNHW
jgi:hypothetical protein